MEKLTFLIKSDFERYVGEQPTCGDRVRAGCNPSFHATLLYRLGSYCYQVLGIKIVGSILQYLSILLFKVDIHPQAQIGPGLAITHLSVVVSGYSKIGKRFTLTHCNTIGAKDPLVSDAPNISDYVFVSAGACILGNVTIGKNVLVGANAVVITDIPDNHIAVGVPAVAKEGKNQLVGLFRDYDAAHPE